MNSKQFLSFNSVQSVTQSLARGKIEAAVEGINKEPFAHSEDSRKRFSIYLYFIMKLDRVDFDRAVGLLEDRCGFLRTYLFQNKLSAAELLRKDKSV